MKLQVESLEDRCVPTTVAAVDIIPVPIPSQDGWWHELIRRYVNDGQPPAPGVEDYIRRISQTQVLPPESYFGLIIVPANFVGPLNYNEMYPPIVK